MPAGLLNGASVATSGDSLIDGMTNGYKWQLDSSRTVDWSLSDGWNYEYWIDPTDISNRITAIFSIISYYSNINFNYLGYYSNPYTANLFGSDINVAPDSGGIFGSNTSTWALGFFPNPADANRGDIYLNINSLANNISYEPGSAGWFVLLHEIGHTLGLKHPHDDGGTGRPTFSELGWSDIDIDFATVMSYEDDYNYNLTYYDPATPMVLDVLALQYLYGKNTTTNITDDIFALNISSMYYTVYDAGGVDLIDQSSANQAWYVVLPSVQLTSLVDTKVGFGMPVSDIDLPAPTNLRWLMGDIENLKGSDYNDLLYGNNFNNSIEGGVGNDTIGAGLGNDTIDGGGGADAAQLSGNRSGYAVSWSGSTLIVSGADGVDRYTNIENLIFDDATYATSSFGSAAATVAATSASKAEGHSGSTAYTFTVTRSGDTSVAHSVGYAVTGSGTNAADASDFVGSALPSGTVSFGVGETSKTVTVNVAADLKVETTEKFTVTLSSPSAGLTIGTATATGRIYSDDFVERSNWDAVTGDDLIWQSGSSFTYTNAVGGLGQNRTIGTPGSGYEFIGVGPFGGGSGADVLWAKAGTGAMVGLGAGSPLSFTLAPVSQPGGSWTLWNKGDLNGDGREELLWKLGESLAVTQLDTNAVKLGDFWLGAPGSNWVAVGAMKLNGDANVDILWKNEMLGGALASTLISADGKSFASAHWLSKPGAGWSYAAAGDFNADGRSDTLWTEANGHIAVMFTATDGTTNAGSYWFSKPGAGWELVGIGDFNGDARADTLWQNPSLDGAIATFITRSSISGGGPNADGYWWGAPGADWHYAGIADANGDGRDDIIFEASSGDAAVMLAAASGSTTGAVYIGLPSTDWNLIG